MASAGLVTGVACASLKVVKDKYGEFFPAHEFQQPISQPFSDYRHTWLSAEPRNPEGTDDANLDTRYIDGTVNSKNRSNVGKL